MGETKKTRKRKRIMEILLLVVVRSRTDGEIIDMSRERSSEFRKRKTSTRSV